MSKQQICLVALLGLMIVGLSAKAQNELIELQPIYGSSSGSEAELQVTANVPFQFTAGDVRFSAGSYLISRLNPINRSILAISAADGRSTHFFMVH